MFGARVAVQFPDDWTATIGELGVWGDIYTATLHKRRYRGLIRLQGPTLDDALSAIRDAEYHKSVEIVSCESTAEHEQAMVLVSAELAEQTPFTVMLENGYMPLDPTILRDGCELFDLFLRSRERLIDLVERLDEIGDVGIERVVMEVDMPRNPNPVTWSALQENLTDRQATVITVAYRLGYFTVPREASLSDVARELSIDKSTAGEHLRRGFAHIAELIAEHQTH